MSSQTGIFLLQKFLCWVMKVVQWLSCVRLFVNPRTVARLASLSFTISWSLLKLTSIESVMPSNHLILCHLLLLLPSIFPSIRVFCNESALRIRWPKYWSFSFSICPSSEYSGLISFRMDWFDLLPVQGTLRVFSSTAVPKHRLFGAQHSLCPALALATGPPGKPQPHGIVTCFLPHILSLITICFGTNGVKKSSTPGGHAL